MQPPIDDAEAFYEIWFGRLRAIGIEELGMDEAEAERVAFDVLVSTLVGDPGRQTGEWLTAAMRSAGRRPGTSGEGR